MKQDGVAWRYNPSLAAKLGIWRQSKRHYLGIEQSCLEIEEQRSRVHLSALHFGRRRTESPRNPSRNRKSTPRPKVSTPCMSSIDLKGWIQRIHIGSYQLILTKKALKNPKIHFGNKRVTRIKVCSKAKVWQEGSFNKSRFTKGGRYCLFILDSTISTSSIRSYLSKKLARTRSSSRTDSYPRIASPSNGELASTKCISSHNSHCLSWHAQELGTFLFQVSCQWH